MDTPGTILLALPADRVPAGSAERIAAAGGGRKVEIASDRAAIERLLPDLEIVAGDFPPSLVASAPRLRWFQAWYAGVDWLQRFPEAKALPFALTTASGIHAEQMTEHLFGLLFAWNRKFREAFAARERREWASFRHSDMATLAGKTMLVIGYGAIGARFAAAAEAFGMTAVGVRRSDAPSADGRRVVPLSRLEEVLPSADVVVNVLPLTPETRGFYDAAFFARCKPGAVFANMGRGGSVDERALEAALRAGPLAGAVTDVAAEEPLPASSPLWDLPNLVLTSHYSGFHPRYDEMAMSLFLDNLGRWARGEPLANLVDKEAGY